jgi:hypothetical protein
MVKKLQQNPCTENVRRYFPHLSLNPTIQFNAYNQSTCPRTTRCAEGKIKVPRLGPQPVSAWRLCAGHDPHAKKAKLGYP